MNLCVHCCCCCSADDDGKEESKMCNEFNKNIEADGMREECTFSKQKG